MKENQNGISCQQLYYQSVKDVIAIAKEIPELNVGGKFMSENEIKSCMDNPKGIFLGLYLNKKLIGFAYGFVETSESACLMYIAIEKQHRGKGYGESLFNHFNASILHFGVKKIYALTTTNLGGDFFKEMGFTHRQVLSYWDRDSAND